jgi:voltage-gated potassium channel
MPLSEKEPAARRVVLGAVVLLLVSVAGAGGYMLAGWSLVDALYMVIITVFSVGYGEVRTLDPTLRWFTMAIIVCGCSSLIYILGAVFQMITEGQLNRVMGTKRMERNIEKLVGHIIVCGYGRMGRILCQQLAQEGVKLVVIDENPERRDEAAAAGHFALCADATSDAVLQSAGIAKALSLATVLSSDALNVFITLTARGLNPTLQIVARGELPSTESKLKQAGADHTVLPAAIGAQRVAHVLTRPSVVEFFESADLGALEQELLTIGIEIQQFEVTGSSSLIRKTVGQLENSGDGGFVVVAVRRAGGSLVQNPKRSFEFAEEDHVLVMGHAEDLPGLLRRFSLPKTPLTVRGMTLR